MQRLIFFAAAAFALAGAGIAIAHGVDSKSVKAVSATFTAATGSNIRTETCTGADGTYTSVRGRWTGASLGDPTLAGNATIDASFLVNATGDGVVSGKIRIDGANHTSAGFEAVYANGHLSGLAEGRGSAPWNKLVANLSADFSVTNPNAGFSAGKLGGGTVGGNAVVISEGGCRPAKPPKPETVGANGSLTKGTNTVAVAGVTCNVPAELANNVAKFNNGERVEIRCTSSGGTNTLVHIESRHGDHD